MKDSKILLMKIFLTRGKRMIFGFFSNLKINNSKRKKARDKMTKKWKNQKRKVNKKIQEKMNKKKKKMKKLRKKKNDLIL